MVICGLGEGAWPSFYYRTLAVVYGAAQLRRILFICSENRLRSPTAEAVFSEMDGIEALSAGTNKDSETLLTGDLIEWADVILVMESSHRQKVARQYRHLLKEKKLAVLDIPDRYQFMDPDLIRLLEIKVPRYLGS